MSFWRVLPASDFLAARFSSASAATDSRHDQLGPGRSRSLAGAGRELLARADSGLRRSTGTIKTKKQNREPHQLMVLLLFYGNCSVWNTSSGNSTVWNTFLLEYVQRDFVQWKFDRRESGRFRIPKKTKRPEFIFWPFRLYCSFYFSGS